MQQLENLKHISFDLWLTLIRSNPEFKPLRNKLFLDFFGIKKGLDEVSEAFLHYDQLFNRINEKTGRNVHYSEMLFVILDHLGIDTELVGKEDMALYYGQMEILFFNHHPLLLNKDTASILDKIRDSGCGINILSNTGFILGKTLRTLLQTLEIGHYFDFQLYSDETGYSKPSQLFYEQVFTAANNPGIIKKHEVLHVGDNKIADIEGATRFGFKAALIDDQNTLSKIFLN